MISLRRPTEETITGYRDAKSGDSPTCMPADDPPSGFHQQRFSRRLGDGTADFDRAKQGLRRWAAHRGSGVEVFPDDQPVAVDETVVVVTRQLGLWVLAACRIIAVADEPTSFGFTYATLPDHPECGYESFTVRLDSGAVRFDIEATSKPGIPLVRLASPITRELQTRATNGYLDALARWTRGTH